MEGSRGFRIYCLVLSLLGTVTGLGFAFGQVWDPRFRYGESGLPNWVIGIPMAAGSLWFAGRYGWSLLKPDR